MGAFIAYLHLAYKVNHFFILVPLILTQFMADLGTVEASVRSELWCMNPAYESLVLIPRYQFSRDASGDIYGFRGAVLY